MAGTGSGSSGSSSVFTGPPAAARRPAGEALGDEAPDAGLRGRQQVVGALGAQAVGDGEAVVEVLDVGQALERGRLVHDHVGLRGGDGVVHRVRVEQVEHHRLRPAAPGGPRLRRAGGADDSWPRSSSCGTRRVPTAPVAPARKTRIECSFRVLPR